MEELRRKLAEVLSDRLYQIIISNPRSKTDVLKIKVRPVMVKGEVCFQETLWKGPQVFHKNRTKEEMLENPHSMAISRIRFLGPRNRVSARLMRSLMR